MDNIDLNINLISLLLSLKEDRVFIFNMKRVIKLILLVELVEQQPATRCGVRSLPAAPSRYGRGLRSLTVWQDIESESAGRPHFYSINPLCYQRRSENEQEIARLGSIQTETNTKSSDFKIYIFFLRRVIHQHTSSNLISKIKFAFFLKEKMA